MDQIGPCFLNISGPFHPEDGAGGWTDERTDGQTDGRMDGRKDGWMDGRTVRPIPPVLQDFVPFGAAAQKPYFSGICLKVED